MNTNRLDSGSVLSADEQAYWAGYKDGIARANAFYARFIEDDFVPMLARKTNIGAFAAIRRAAEVAREYDRIYREAFAMCDCSTYSVTPDGDDVRRAIRAAIGSEKA